MMDVVYPHAGPTRNGNRLPRISKNGKKKKWLHQVLMGKVNFYTLQVRVSLPRESPWTEGAWPATVHGVAKRWTQLSS